VQCSVFKIVCDVDINHQSVNSVLWITVASTGSLTVDTGNKRVGNEVPTAPLAYSQDAAHHVLCAQACICSFTIYACFSYTSISTAEMNAVDKQGIIDSAARKLMQSIRPTQQLQETESCRLLCNTCP